MATITYTTTGTVDTGTIHVTVGTTPSHGWAYHAPLNPPPAPMPKILKARVPVVKRDFWYGVEWEEHTSYMPRKSITGKYIIGKMHKRTKKVVRAGSTHYVANVKHTVLDRATKHTQYANTKELFQEKLKGKA